MGHRADLDYGLLSAAIVAALLGSILGNHYLPKATMRGVQGVVAVMLFAVALGLISGLL
jgi:hypothetical protein